MARGTVGQECTSSKLCGDRRESSEQHAGRGRGTSQDEETWHAQVRGLWTCVTENHNVTCYTLPGLLQSIASIVGGLSSLLSNCTARPRVRIRGVYSDAEAVKSYFLQEC